MLRVEEAEKIIQSLVTDFGKETIPFTSAQGRVLAEDIYADRDLPPYNRVSMDGIAIRYEASKKGISSFHIKATQAAGDQPIEINSDDDCIEVMTGAALSSTTDTVIRYEDLEITSGEARVITEKITKGQNVHHQGKDKKQHDVVAKANQLIGPALVNIAASVGAGKIVVKKLPRVVVVSTGDEIIDVGTAPGAYQIRNSNSHAILAVLKEYSVAAESLHLPDDPAVIKTRLEYCLNTSEVIILSGGISMGKFDYLPQVLETLSVKKFFHKVQQKPGKPFWFGQHNTGVLVFAFPGNPVSTFMCLHRYFLPWLDASLGLNQRPLFAVLNKDFVFTSPLQYFLQVSLHVSTTGQLLATPVEGNGSGDFSNLLLTDAFMELPSEQQRFERGEVFRVWPFRRTLPG